MKKHFLHLLGLCLLSGALGCKTNVPMVKHQPGTFQTKLQAAEHWRIMAHELVGRIASDPALRSKPVYVQPPAEVTPFSEAYGKLLMSELMRSSVPVAEVPGAGQVWLSVTNQLIQHGDREFCCNPTTVFGAIGYGLRDIFVGDGLGTERQTRKELLVTATIHENEVLRLTDTQIVYVSPMDGPLYAPARLAEGHLQKLSDWQILEVRARAVDFSPWW